MNLAKHESNRLEQVLIKDKLKSPERFSLILKKETEMFLNNFFELAEDYPKVSIEIDDLGYYCCHIVAKAKRIHI